MFDFYPRWEATFAQIQLVLFMLGMGATLGWRDFAAVVRRPGPLLVAFLGHILLMPLLAVAIIGVFRLGGGIALGLILTAAMPGGTLSKAFTYLGRGNVPLAISLSFFSTLATLVTVPATLYLLGGAYIPAGFTMPIGAIVFDVVAYLLVPLLVGMAIGQAFPKIRQRLQPACDPDRLRRRRRDGSVVAWQRQNQARFARSRRADRDHRLLPRRHAGEHAAVSPATLAESRHAGRRH